MFIFLEWEELDTRHSTLGSVIFSLPLELSGVLSLVWNTACLQANIQAVSCPAHVCLPSFHKGSLELSRPLSA